MGKTPIWQDDALIIGGITTVVFYHLWHLYHPQITTRLKYGNYQPKHFSTYYCHIYELEISDIFF